MINPVNEGVMTLVFVLIITGITGNKMWDQKSPFFKLKWNVIYLIFTVTFSLASSIMSVVQVCFVMKLKKHLMAYSVIGYLSLSGFCLAYLLTPEVRDEQIILIGYIFSFMFAKLTVR